MDKFKKKEKSGDGANVVKAPTNPVEAGVQQDERSMASVKVAIQPSSMLLHECNSLITYKTSKPPNAKRVHFNIPVDAGDSISVQSTAHNRTLMQIKEFLYAGPGTLTAVSNTTSSKEKSGTAQDFAPILSRAMDVKDLGSLLQSETTDPGNVGAFTSAAIDPRSADNFEPTENARAVPDVLSSPAPPQDDTLTDFKEPSDFWDLTGCVRAITANENVESAESRPTSIIKSEEHAQLTVKSNREDEVVDVDIADAPVAEVDITSQPTQEPIIKKSKLLINHKDGTIRGIPGTTPADVSGNTVAGRKQESTETKKVVKEKTKAKAPTAEIQNEVKATISRLESLEKAESKVARIQRRIVELKAEKAAAKPPATSAPSKSESKAKFTGKTKQKPYGANKASMPALQKIEGNNPLKEEPRLGGQKEMPGSDIEAPSEILEHEGKPAPDTGDRMEIDDEPFRASTRLGRNINVPKRYINTSAQNTVPAKATLDQPHIATKVDTVINSVEQVGTATSKPKPGPKAKWASKKKGPTKPKPSARPQAETKVKPATKEKSESSWTKPGMDDRGFPKYPTNLPNLNLPPKGSYFSELYVPMSNLRDEDSSITLRAVGPPVRAPAIEQTEAQKACRRMFEYFMSKNDAPSLRDVMRAEIKPLNGVLVDPYKFAAGAGYTNMAPVQNPDRPPRLNASDGEDEVTNYDHERRDDPPVATQSETMSSGAVPSLSPGVLNDGDNPQDDSQENNYTSMTQPEVTSAIRKIARCRPRKNPSEIAPCLLSETDGDSSAHGTESLAHTRLQTAQQDRLNSLTSSPLSSPDVARCTFNDDEDVANPLSPTESPPAKRKAGAAIGVRASKRVQKLKSPAEEVSEPTSSSAEDTRVSISRQRLLGIVENVKEIYVTSIIMEKRKENAAKNRRIREEERKQASKRKRASGSAGGKKFRKQDSSSSPDSRDISDHKEEEDDSSGKSNHSQGTYPPSEANTSIEPSPVPDLWEGKAPRVPNRNIICHRRINDAELLQLLRDATIIGMDLQVLIDELAGWEIYLDKQKRQFRQVEKNLFRPEYANKEIQNAGDYTSQLKPLTHREIDHDLAMVRRAETERLGREAAFDKETARIRAEAIDIDRRRAKARKDKERRARQKAEKQAQIMQGVANRHEEQETKVAENKTGALVDEDEEMLDVEGGENEAGYAEMNSEEDQRQEAARILIFMRQGDFGNQATAV